MIKTLFGIRFCRHKNEQIAYEYKIILTIASTSSGLSSLNSFRVYLLRRKKDIARVVTPKPTPKARLIRMGFFHFFQKSVSDTLLKDIPNKQVELEPKQGKKNLVFR